MKKKILILPLFAILILCCTYPQKINQTTIPDDEWLGKWQWVQSERIGRGMAPRVFTPISEGMEVWLEINSSQIILNRGKKKSRLAYSVQKTEFAENFLSLDNAEIEKFISSGPLYFQGDTLLISGSYNDAGMNHLYVKMK